MYKTGATITEQYVPDADNIPWDTLIVSHTSNLYTNSTTFIFNNKGDTVPITIAEKIGDNKIVVRNDLDTIDRWAGIAGDFEHTYGLADPQLVSKAFGEKTDGTDGGCFTEFVEAPLENRYSCMPCWDTLTESYRKYGEFFSYWFDNSKLKHPGFKNTLLMGKVRAIEGAGPGEIILDAASDKYHVAAIVDAWEFEYEWETFVHELGHLLTPNIEPYYYDEYTGAKDYTGNNYCIMNYYNVSNDKNVEFSETALWILRSNNDTLEDEKPDGTIGLFNIDDIKPYPSMRSEYQVNLSINQATMRDNYIMINCSMQNIGSDPIYTASVGGSHNYFAVVTPEGWLFRHELHMRILNSSPINPGDTKTWHHEESIEVNNLREYSVNGIYKLYWIFHNNVLEIPIEIEKSGDNRYSVLSY